MPPDRVEEKLRILLVDDESTIRRLAQRILEMEGYEVVEAGTVKGALAAAEGKILHLVVTDYKLPDQSGAELLAHLRQNSPNLPAVVMSGYGSEVLDDTPCEGARTLFLPKPFSRDTLREKALAALGL